MYKQCFLDAYPIGHIKQVVTKTEGHFAEVDIHGDDLLSVDLADGGERSAVIARYVRHDRVVVTDDQ